MKPLRIVIADDETDIRDYFNALLPRFGHQVVGQATDGDELMALCAREKPDLVITDIMMPELSGLKAAAKIAEAVAIPMIVISSCDRTKDDEFPWLVDYLVKPITSLDLKRAVDKIAKSGYRCAI